MANITLSNTMASAPWKHTNETLNTLTASYQAFCKKQKQNGPLRKVRVTVKFQVLAQTELNHVITWPD